MIHKCIDFDVILYWKCEFVLQKTLCENNNDWAEKIQQRKLVQKKSSSYEST